MLDEGTLKDIPIIGTVAGTVSFVNSVSRMLFAKKVYEFLFQLRVIGAVERDQEVEKINSSPKYKARVGLTILELLEKVDSLGKPEILGKMFAAVIQQKITYMEFLRAADSVQKVFYYDLLELKEHCQGSLVIDLAIRDSIFNSGLTSTDFAAGFTTFMDDNDSKNMDSPTSLSELGVVVINIGMA